MKDVYGQVEKHAEFNGLSEGTKMGFNVARSGISWTTAANNKWVRQVWKHLYLGEPLK